MISHIHLKWQKMANRKHTTTADQLKATQGKQASTTETFSITLQYLTIALIGFDKSSLWRRSVWLSMCHWVCWILSDISTTLSTIVLTLRWLVLFSLCNVLPLCAHINYANANGGCLFLFPIWDRKSKFLADSMALSWMWQTWEILCLERDANPHFWHSGPVWYNCTM